MKHKVVRKGQKCNCVLFYYNISTANPQICRLEFALAKALTCLFVSRSETD
jgi:hypothetical protein